MNNSAAAPQALTLKTLISGAKIVVAPGVSDALGAVLVQQAGFQVAYLSGASIAYTRFGRPDIGLVSMSEVADTLSAITERITLPVIVDADTGFGNALNVIRTVRQFESSGAAAIQLEDQTQPKRCGHLAGKTLVDTGEMVGKIRAALDTRRSAETLIIARTDSIAVEGFESTLERAEKYFEAGADILFIEAPQSEGQMASLVDRFRDRVPLLANMVEGGKTPQKSASENRLLYRHFSRRNGACLDKDSSNFSGQPQGTRNDHSFSRSNAGFRFLKRIVRNP